MCFLHAHSLRVSAQRWASRGINACILAGSANLRVAHTKNVQFSAMTGRQIRCELDAVSSDHSGSGAVPEPEAVIGSVERCGCPARAAGLAETAAIALEDIDVGLLRGNLKLESSPLTPLGTDTATITLVIVNHGHVMALE